MARPRPPLPEAPTPVRWPVEPTYSGEFTGFQPAGDPDPEQVVASKIDELNAIEAAEDAADADAVDDEAALPADPPADEPQFLFIAGTAGTGKSTLARQRAQSYRDAVLLATTGIAAVNLGAGTTLNSHLHYYDTASMQTEYELGRIGAILRRNARSGFRRLIIDEVSMMDAAQLSILCLAVDDANEALAGDTTYDGGPIGVTLVGDFCQLPPVKAKFAFESPVWDRFAANTTLLTEPRRQADPAFVAALQAVRRGDKSATDYFRPFLTKVENRAYDGSSIMAKNDEVDRYNKIRLLQLPGPEHTFRSKRGGQQASEWKHIPETLVVKPGALVMILANAYDEDRNLIYCNGDLAIYLDRANDSTAKVRLLRTGEEQWIKSIVRTKDESTGAKGVKKDRTTAEGWIEYTPLRLAWGTTVHKSQGLTLDRVQLLINSQFWMTSGMLYVGLSRCRTPQGLQIVGTVDQFAARVRSNPALQAWY